MDTRSIEELLAYDREHIWHPYASMGHQSVVYPVVSASSVRLNLADGRELIDGISSWWCAIHGYNHPALNEAARAQLGAMSHVMFGGLTHEPAVRLAERLVGLVPAPLETVFFSDSGSVSVEVAMKLAVQYWVARGEPRRKKFLTIRGGYHGDTFGAMSVCDPVTGMHSLFTGFLTEQIFADRPSVRFGEPWREEDLDSLKHCLETRQREIAALILEPIVQGAGGMWFYSSDYLRRARTLCDEYGILLICDEIATGFGRTGRLFAAEHAGIAPDILCVGKALTGGYMSLAATLMTRHVADTISDEGAGVFMHGPTFMANPLSCAVALASIDLLLAGPWQSRIAAIEQQLREELAPCAGLSNVADVRALGAIGVVELKQPVDMHVVPRLFVDRGVWVRPFGRLVYLMPPYVIEAEELRKLTGAIYDVVSGIS